MLELKFTSSITSDGLKFLFQEVTGIYHVNTNPTGWGTPNKEISGAIAARLEVIFPNTTEDDIFLIDLSADFPSDDTSQAIEFTMPFFDGIEGDIFPDGVYKVYYIVTVDGEDFIASKYIFGYSQVKCCVEKMFVELSPLDCSGNCLEKASDALTTWAYYKALLANATCGNITKAEELLCFVNKLCSGRGNCENCK